MRISVGLASCVLAAGVSFVVRAQTPAAGGATRPVQSASAQPPLRRRRVSGARPRPPLFIKEDWKQILAAASIR
jgi:hypothetical protein